jgi:nitrite reductase (NADH) large subunit
LKRYLIVGDGVAGARGAIKIKEADARGEIHIFTEEAYPFYYRIRFPEMVAGEIKADDLIIHPDDFYQKKGIALHLKERITGGDPAKREITSDKGKTYSYDALLMATGGHAFIPPIKGVEKKGVFTLRTMSDALTLKEYSDQAKRAILIGSGLVGLETGGALLRRGIKVDMIESNPRILPRQTDPEGSHILQAKMEQMGFSFHLNGRSEEILGSEKVEGLRLKDGRIIEGEMVILSAGVRPELTLAKALGAEIKNGVLVDDRLKTSHEGIYAAGDVAEHRGRVYGIWPAALRQGEAAGINMAGGNVIYDGTVVSNTLKVVGVNLTAAGEIDPEGKLECIVKSDREKCTYCKVAFKEDRIVGCVLLGDVAGAKEILSAIEKKIRVKEMNNILLEKGVDISKRKPLQTL